MKDALELRRKRKGLVDQARDILDKAEKDVRNLTGEEETTYENIMADVDKMAKEIDLVERQTKLDAEMRESIEEPHKPEMDPPQEKREEVAGLKLVTPEQKSAYEKFRKIYGTSEYRKSYNNLLANGIKGLSNDEYRALQADSDIYGGFLQAPEQMVAGLIMAMDDLVFMRKIATIHSSVNAESLGAVSLDNDPADPTWTSEIGTPSEDSTMSFGKRDLHPHPLTKLIKISEKLLRVATQGAEQLVRDRLSYKFAITEENCFLNGTGVNQPLGVFIASDSGISTSYDVSTGNTTTTITADGLINAKYDLKGQYWGRAKWIFHRDALKMIRKLKTGEGDYIWQPGITLALPDRILEVPYIMSEYAPNTFTTGCYVGIIGDFTFYWIADALNITIRRLDELYAATNQIGFKSILECDGMPVLGEAFRRVKLA